MVTIRNGRGIVSTQYSQDARVAGEPAGEGYDRPYENPLLPQISTLTLAEQVDVSDEIVAGQVWTITLTDPDGVAYTTLYTVTAADDTAGTDAEGLAYMAGVLAAALEANSELTNLVSATSTGAVITVTWLHPNQGAWTITAVCTPAAAETVLLATPATSQTAGGTVLPMARFVAEIAPETGGLRRARLPNAATDRLAGVALRDLTQDRLFDTDPNAVDSYPAGSMVGVRERGDVHMVNTSTTAAVIGDPVYAVISTTGGDALGEVRPDRDGVGQVITATPTVANTTVYGLQVFIPEFEDQPSQVVVAEYTSDASATDVEICDGLRADFAAKGLASTVTLGGTTTITFTDTIVGRQIAVTDVMEAGDWTSITTTIAAAQYTLLAPRARWVRPAAAGATGTINLQR